MRARITFPPFFSRLAFGTPGGSPYVPPVDVWLVVGDSEAAQGGTLPGPLPDFIPPPTNDATLYYVSQLNLTTVSPLVVPSGVNTTTWSLAAPFAYYRWRQSGRVQIVADCAVSGTDSTYYLFSTDHSTPSGYWRAIASTTAALNAQPGTRFRGILIYGGANDGSLASPAWYANWTQAISDLESGIGRSAQEIWYLELPPGPPVAPYNTSWNTVRADMVARNGGRWKMVPQINGASWGTPTYVHLDGKGLDQTAQLLCTTNDGAIPALPFVDPTALSGARLVLDTATNCANSGGFVTGWTNQLSTEVFSATAGQRPAYAASVPAWNNQPTVTYDGVDDYLQSNAASTAYDYLSDGSGASIGLVFDAANAQADLASTYIGTGSGGILIRLDTGYVKCWVTNGAGFGNNYLDGNSFKCPVTTNTRTCIMVRFATGNASIRHRASNWIRPSTYPGGFGPPTHCTYALQLGKAFYKLSGQVQHVFCANRVLSDDEANQWVNAMTVRYSLEQWP